MQSIGRYQIQELLGKGGMGAVYRAFDPQLGREVAIKVLKQGLGSSAPQRARFQREAEVLARLRHPHVVTLHEVGEVEGSLYLVLDFVAGETLEARLRRMGPLDVSEALRITTQLARALVQVHERGALHRDLKPENVLLDASARPLLTDFGLAFDAEAEDRLSQTGTFMGTPGFASPEQARGDRAEIGPASDVWGLGAILYACLTGRAPFEGATLLMVVAATQQGTPDLPSAGRPDVPPALEAVCLRCLEKDPQDRYPSAAALLEALEEVPQLGDRRRTKRLRWLGLGALLLACGAGAAAFGREARPAPTPSPTPEAQRTPAEPRLLRWTLTKGQRQRWTLQTGTTVRVEAPPDLDPVKEIFGAGRSSGAFELEVRVARVRPARLSLELQIKSFRLEVQAEGKQAETLDSKRLLRGHAYRRLLLGRQLRVDFDPASGRAERVRGLEALARELSAATGGQASPPQGFKSNRELQSVLNFLLHVLPGDEGLRAWKIPEAIDLSAIEVKRVKRALAAFEAEIVYGKLGLTKRITASRGLPAELTWHAQDSLRDLSGQATFADGRITSSQVTDRADANVRLTLRDAQIRVRIDDRFDLAVEDLPESP